MNAIALHLYKAQDGLDAYAIARGAPNSASLPDSWLAQKGFGSDFEKVWTVELQNTSESSPAHVDWDTVLERVIEAYHLSDPVIADYEWPQNPKRASMAQTTSPPA